METKHIESGVQLFSRLTHKHQLSDINPHLFPEGGPNPNQIIELVSESEGNSTTLLIDFIARCILPSTYNVQWKDCGVVLVNTMFQMNLMDIIKVLNIHLKNSGVLNVKSTLESSLRNLTIFNCYDSEQIRLTLHNLERKLHKNENVALLIIDSITSQYWSEKMTNQMLSVNQHCKKMFELLHKVVKNLNLTLLFSRYERNVSRTPVSTSVDYKIIVQKLNKQDYKAVIFDFNKEEERTVNYQVSNIVTF